MATTPNLIQDTFEGHIDSLTEQTQSYRCQAEEYRDNCIQGDLFFEYIIIIYNMYLKLEYILLTLFYVHTNSINSNCISYVYTLLSE